MNNVLIIPTGIDAEIGGHAGDGNLAAKLIGSVSKNLILHPNVVNGSDLNEMPENSWYVEGSMLDRFLEGKIKLEKPKSNKILIVVNSNLKNEQINAVNAARITLGIDCFILVLEEDLIMIAKVKNGCSTGEVYGFTSLVDQIKLYDFDALAISTPVIVSKEIAMNYFKFGGINPWGGVESVASKLISNLLDKPVAHAPIGDTLENFNEIVDPKMAPEVISTTYLFSVLKGLHKAPRVSYNRGLSVFDIDFLISPYGCYGRPHEACLSQNIPIILVKENKTILNQLPERAIVLDNYLEVAGYILSQKLGIKPSLLRRPISQVQIFK